MTSPIPVPATYRQPDTVPSGIERLWNAIKPVPADLRRMTPEQIAARQRQIRMVRAGMALVVAGLAAWGGYHWYSTAQERAQAKFQQGMQVMAVGDFKSAEKIFTSAVNTWPQMANGYLERGLARKNKGDIDGAFQDFQKAVEIDSGLVQAHTELGLIYRNRGDLQHAAGEMTEAINLGAANKFGENTDAYYERGQLYQAMGQPQKALDDYNLAIHEEPDAPYIYRARALVRDALGDADGATADRAEASHIEAH